jgi:hypothetical protein
MQAGASLEYGGREYFWVDTFTQMHSNLEAKLDLFVDESRYAGADAVFSVESTTTKSKLDLYVAKFASCGSVSAQAGPATPTPYPTAAATNPPKPAFVPSDFDSIADAPVVTNFDAVTMIPTAAPTALPTSKGFNMQPVATEVRVVTTDLVFPLSPAEVSSPVMKITLEAGFAASLGMPPDKVAITMINGQAVTERRHLSDSATDITFGIESLSTDKAQMQQLKDDIVAAATEGAIVANVQQKALQNGVLLESLKAMHRELEAPALAEDVKVITTYMSVPDTDSPTKSPTQSISSVLEYSDMAEQDVLLLALVGIFCSSFVCCACAYCFWFVQKRTQHAAGDKHDTPKAQTMVDAVPQTSV